MSLDQKECPNCHGSNLYKENEGFHYKTYKGKIYRTPYILYSCNGCHNNHERQGKSELDPENN